MGSSVEAGMLSVAERPSLSRLFDKYKQRSRQIRVDLFFRLLKPNRQASLLDVGGGQGRSYFALRNYFRTCLIIDVNPSTTTWIKDVSTLHSLVGTGCALPF